MNKTELKEIKLYEENENYFLSVVYQREDDSHITELTIPKIALPFRNKYAPDIYLDRCYSSYPADLPIEEWYIPISGKGLRVCEDEVDNNRVYFYEKILKEKSVRMTMEEIEKKLGHKVEIVQTKNPVNAAYDVLLKALKDTEKSAKKSSKAMIAMQEAIGYLGECLDDHPDKEN